MVKTFKYPNGRKAGDTMTVAELRQALDKYPGNLPVMATWEGVHAYVDSQNFSTDYVHKGSPDDREKCLIIDVEGH